MQNQIFKHIEHAFESKGVIAKKNLASYVENEKSFYFEFKIRNSVSNVIDLFSPLELIVGAFKFGNLKTEWTIERLPDESDLLLSIKVYE